MLDTYFFATRKLVYSRSKTECLLLYSWRWTKVEQTYPGESTLIITVVIPEPYSLVLLTLKEKNSSELIHEGLNPQQNQILHTTLLGYQGTLLAGICLIIFIQFLQCMHVSEFYGLIQTCSVLAEHFQMKAYPLNPMSFPRIFFSCLSIF